MTVVSRSRIVAAIERSASLGIALVIAPAGYGKTAALEDAFGEIGFFVDTASAAGGVDGLARAIVTAVMPQAGRALAQVLRRQTIDDHDTYLTAWLAKRLRNLDEPILLDDFQRLNADPAIRDFVVALIKATVPNTRWVIACRDTPELPFGTWLASNRMLLPTAATDLAFTVEDARSLANAMSVSITDDELAAIVDDAEGWPLVVRLLLSAWERAPALPPVRLRTRDLLFDFFETQVWSEMTPADRRLLSAAAVAPQAGADLLQSVGFAEAGQTLAAIARRFPLLRRTTKNGYQLQELFRDFILERDDNAAQRSELIRALTMAYSRSGEISQALATAISGKAHELVVELLGASGVQMIDEGQRGPVARALASLPPPYRNTTSALAIRGYLRAAEGNTAVAEADLRAVQKEDLPRPLAGSIALKHANLAMVRGDLATALADVQPYINDSDQRLRAEAMVQTAAVHAMLGEEAAAREALATVVELVAGIPTDVRARMYVAIAYTQTYLHEFAAAEQTALLAVEFATENEDASVLQSAFCRLYVIAMWLYTDISIAARYAERWLQLARESGDRANLAFALISSIGLSAERADFDGYRELLDEFRRLRFPLPARHEVPLRWACALVDVGNGRTREAAVLMSHVMLANESAAARAFVRSLSALLWAMAGEEERAAELLAGSTLQLAGIESDNEYASFASAYRALAWWTIGKGKLAERAFIAERDGIPERDRAIVSVIRSICFSSRATMTRHKLELLTAPLLALDLAGHVRFLQASFTKHSAGDLTRTELEILRALRGGRSTIEVAQRLGRSPRTVDWHIDAVCRKIGCSGRAAALAFAVDQGWI